MKLPLIDEGIFHSYLRNTCLRGQRPLPPAEEKLNESWKEKILEDFEPFKETGASTGVHEESKEFTGELINGAKQF